MNEEKRKHLVLVEAERERAREREREKETFQPISKKENKIKNQFSFAISKQQKSRIAAKRSCQDQLVDLKNTHRVISRHDKPKSEGNQSFMT